MFEVGQRVVCITSGPWFDLDGTEYPSANAPKKNHVYTIKGLLIADIPPVIGHLYLELDGFDMQWFSQWFRPLETRKTSIDVFNQILVKAPKPAKPTVDA